MYLKPLLNTETVRLGWRHLWMILFCRWADLACEIAIRAVKTVTVDEGDGHREIDTKRYAKIEKIPGGTIEDSRVLAGVMFNKVLYRDQSISRADVTFLHAVCICCITVGIWIPN